MVARALVRIVLVVLAGASVVTAVAVTGRMAEDPGRPTQMPANPLARELARCKRLRLAEADDAACRAVWAKNQDRFFGSSRSTEAPTGSVAPGTSVRSPGATEGEPSPLAPDAGPSRPASQGAAD